MSSTYLSHRWGVWGRAKGLDFEVFHEQVGNKRAKRRTCGCTMDLFIILTLEEEVSVFKANSQRVTICGNRHVCPLWESLVLL